MQMHVVYIVLLQYRYMQCINGKTSRPLHKSMPRLAIHIYTLKRQAEQKSSAS
jgi:hypothetical protein